MAAASHVYSFFGHGSEILEDTENDGKVLPKEIDLPAGYTLILTEECGVYGTLPPHIYRVMANHLYLPYFQNPTENLEMLSKILKKNLQVYVGPTKIPNFLFTFYNADASDVNDQLFISGVHELPLKPIVVDSEEAAPGSSIFLSQKDVPYKAIAPFFKNAALPRFKQFRKIVQSIVEEGEDETYDSWAAFYADQKKEGLEHLPTRLLKEKLDFTISDVFRKLGPGIYYNCLCRSVHSYNANNVISVNNNVWNVPAFVVSTLGPKAALTAEETAILGKSKAILAARKKTGTVQIKTDLPKYLRLLDIFSSRAVEESTAVSALKLVREMPLDKLNTLHSVHTGNMLIHLSVRTDLRLLKLLLERGVDLTVRNFRKETPLHVAIHERAEEAAALLLEKVPLSSIGMKDEDGHTALMAACDYNLPFIVNLLVNDERGFEPFVDYTAADAEGDTALHLACEEDAEVCCALLISKHRELLALKNAAGLTPWEKAIESHSGRCLRAIQHFAPEFAVPVAGAMEAFLDSRTEKDSLEQGVATLLAVGVVPTQDDLDIAVESLKSNPIAIALFDRLWNSGLVSHASQYVELEGRLAEKMRPFMDHVSAALAAFNAATATAATATSASANKTKKNRRNKMRRTRSSRRD
jgi:hypothetical protein